MTNEPLDQQAGLYPVGIGKINEYTLHPGVCVLPLAEDPPTNPTELGNWSPVVVLRLHASYRQRRVVYRSNKTNNPPAGIPSPASQGAFVFVGGEIGVTTALNSSMTNFDWTVVTEYDFVENCVSRVEDGFVLGSYQVPTTMSAQNAQMETGTDVFGPPPAGDAVPGPMSGQGQRAKVLISPGAVGYAGVDAQTGFVMGASIDFYGSGWGYNCDAFLPGEFFNPRLVNSDLCTQEQIATLTTGGG